MRIVVRRETPDGTTRPHEVVVDRYIARAKGNMIGTWGESWFRARETALVLLQCEPWELELETVTEEPEETVYESFQKGVVDASNGCIAVGAETFEALAKEVNNK